MELDTVTIDLLYFLLATPLGTVAAMLSGALILASFVDGIISAVQVIRR